MKKSQVNLAVLENFVLWFTHMNRDEASDEGGLKCVFQLTGERFYQAIDDYIEEDHVDGKDNREDHIVTYGAESSFKTEDRDKEYPEAVVVVGDFGPEIGTQTACTIEGTDVVGVNKLIEYMKDPYGKMM
tara:strand:+ start:12125 stop:12514 length:390 start_codon:yes stop_codon:yes gene_type:complete